LERTGPPLFGPELWTALVALTLWAVLEIGDNRNDALKPASLEETFETLLAREILGRFATP